jgi:hypothetical protein
MEMRLYWSLVQVITIFIYCTNKWVSERQVSPFQIRLNAYLNTWKHEWEIIEYRVRIINNKIIALFSNYYI